MNEQTVGTRSKKVALCTDNAYLVACGSSITLTKIFKQYNISGDWPPIERV